MALGPGSIAFTGFNADGNDNLAFVVLEDIAAGTVINFTDNEWTGSAFNTGEAAWSWTATGDITAGTVVTMDGLAAGQTAVSNLGTIAFSDETQRDISISNETVYAYTGEASTPAFVAAISNDNFTSANGLLTNTGLVEGQTAISLTSLDADADIAVYAGVRGASSFDALLPMINNPTNWISQDTAFNDENDGTPPDLPLPTSPFVGEPNFQTINFTGPLTVSQAEGDSGVIVYTFTVERSGGTVGAIEFSGTIGGTTNGADFGGTKPLTFSGVIADGATSATVTIEISGDTMLEPTETAVLTLTDVHNDSASVALGSSVTRTAIVTDEDPYVVVDGQVYTGVVTVPAGEALTVEHGGTIQGDVLLNNPGILPSLTNSGTITSGGTAIIAGNNRALDFTGGITIVNNADGLIEGATRAIRVTADLHGSTFTVVNAGTIKSSNDETIRLDDAINGHFVVENLAGGLIYGGSQQDDVMRLGSNTTVVNAGTITNALDVPGAGRGGDGVDFKSGTGSSLHNLAGGHIEASRHGVTGERGVTVVNDAGGLIVGRNGSAVNIDNPATVENTVYVTNYGTMLGKSANYSDSDGDAVDVDGLAVVENYGSIRGLGHNGRHNGEPNVSEGMAIGGGTVTNHAGGEIYGYGRAIQFDDSGNAGAFSAATVVNAGLIQGDGNLPTDVTPEEVALFAERIRGGEAINIVGSFADTVTNMATGQIIGGVKMDGGDDLLVNKGSMTATGGSAADLGDGNDTFEFHAGSTVNGLLDGGAGEDTLKLIGPGMDAVGTNENFEKLDVQSGMWSIQSDAYDNINVATGAMVMSQLELADQSTLKVAQGGSVLVTNGSDAVVSQGKANIENAGLIQALGLQGGAAARAISVSGGSVYNKLGGIILAQGAAIVSTNAPAWGLEIVNDGMIQSLSGEAITLVGEEGDLLVNTRTGAIMGTVSTGNGNDLVTNQGTVVAGPSGVSFDLGDGRDTLNLHEGSTVTGKILLGAGNDVVSSQSASDLVIEAGDGQDSIATGGGDDRIIGGEGIDLVHAGGGNDVVYGDAGEDRLQGGDGNDQLYGGADNDILIGGVGNDQLDGGDGVDTADYSDDRAGITVDFTAGTATGTDAGSDSLVSIEKLIAGSGNDTFNVSTAGPIPASLDGGAGTDTLKLLGTGTGAMTATTNVENLLVQSGIWSAAASDYSAITIKGGATLTSAVALNNNDTLSVEAGGTLTGAISRSGTGNIVVDNAGLIEVSGRVLNGGSSTGTLTLNNLAGATIKQVGSDTDVIRPGQNATINNWGTIITGEGFAGGGDLIDFQGNIGGKVNNNAGGWMEGAKHAVTGDESVTVVNRGTMIGRNGSAVNIDNGGSEAEKVFITNYGTMEGRSAELADSDGDAIDVDGLAQILNYGRIAGMGAEGYHDGEPNVSEGIAIGGGSILNYGEDAVIYGYGRAIQVDNSSNENALGKTFINNDGLIQGDGHGPEGVDPEDAAEFDLRGNEAINLVGDYDDEILNQSTGRIVGGVSMGGGNDRMNNSGSIVATGGSAIDMGAGDDWLWLYAGPNSKVEGTILLGTGNDLVFSTADSSFVIEGGDGNDEMYISGYTGGDDTLSGGAGNDRIYAGLGEDRIDGGADNDSLYGEAGDDLIEGGAGDDTIDGGADDDIIFGDAGNDTLIGGLGNDVIKGGADNDTFVVQATGDGRDSYDGGDGIDTLDYSALNTAVNLTLRDGVSTFQTDTIENIENVIGGSANDRLTGNSLDNVLTGNAGNDTINGGAGNDMLHGGDGNDTLNGGADNDQLFGDANNDVLKGAAGNDHLEGGEGNDDLDGGAGNDMLLGSVGNDIIKGGAGNDVLTGGEGNDTLTGGAGNDTYVFNSLSDGIDTITDFKVSGTSTDQIQLSASMFQGFTGDDAFDLIGSGFLRAVSGGGVTQLQIDVDGGGDSFVTLANLAGNFSNGMIADHLIVQQDPIA